MTTQQQNQQTTDELEDLIHEEAYLYCCEQDSPNSPDFQSFLEHTEEQLMDFHCGIGPAPFHSYIQTITKWRTNYLERINL